MMMNFLLAVLQASVSAKDSPNCCAASRNRLSRDQSFVPMLRETDASRWISM